MRLTSHTIVPAWRWSVQLPWRPPYRLSHTLEFQSRLKCDSSSATITWPRECVFLSLLELVMHEPSLPQHFLIAEDARRAIATRGKQLFMKRSMTTSVMGCVNTLLMTSGCDPILVG